MRVEDTDGGLEVVEVRDARDSRKNIRPRGEDFVAGDTVIPAGATIAPAQVGVLASLGLPAVEVHRRPVVAILGSGDGLVDLDRFHEVLAGRKIVTSNSYTLSALVRANGGVPLLLGNAADSPESLRALLGQVAGRPDQEAREGKRQLEPSVAKIEVELRGVLGLDTAFAPRPDLT